jgi:hypothetical protein
MAVLCGGEDDLKRSGALPILGATSAAAGDATKKTQECPNREATAAWRAATLSRAFDSALSRIALGILPRKTCFSPEGPELASIVPPLFSIAVAIAIL